MLVQSKQYLWQHVLLRLGGVEVMFRANEARQFQSRICDIYYEIRPYFETISVFYRYREGCNLISIIYGTSNRNERRTEWPIAG